MIRPAKIEFFLGGDEYGRRTSLKGVLRTTGDYIWRIESEALSQQDQGDTLRSLTTDQLTEIGLVAAQIGALK